MTEVDLMVFDFDGTLVCSGDDLVASVNHTLEQLGRASLQKNKIIGYIGDGVRKLIERSLGDAFPEKFDEALQVFMAYYGKHLLDSTDLYPGVIDVLDHFQNKKKIIVTNKMQSFTVRITEGLGIAHHFNDIIGVDSTSYKKPDSRLIAPVFEKYGIKKRRSVVIGDGDNDILLAKNIGALSCALLNGLGARDKLLSLKPDYFCESIEEVKTMFC